MPQINFQSTEQQQLLAAKLNTETAIAEWRELEIFFARGQLLVVDSSLDLIEVAMAIHLDNKAKVENLLSRNQLIHPSPEWVKAHCQPDTPFWTVVIAPFVMIQQQQRPER
jgi:hypothetical protein